MSFKYLQKIAMLRKNNNFALKKLFDEKNLPLFRKKGTDDNLLNEVLFFRSKKKVC
jgi:hypothetical protein